MNFRRLARDQRRLAALTFAFIAMHVGFVVDDPMALAARGPVWLLMAGIWALLYVVCAALVGAIVSQLRLNGAIVVFIGLLAFVPFVGLIPIVAVQAQLNRFWKLRGLKPSLFGVDPALAEGLQHGTRCAGCGYDLQGNESGVCPECGRAIGLAAE